MTFPSPPSQGYGPYGHPAPHSGGTYPPATAGPHGEVPLGAPLYGATFGQAIRRFFTKYTDFGGRASLSEYWWVVLLDTLVVLVGYAFIIAGIAGGSTDGSGGSHPTPLLGVGVALIVIYYLAVLVPTLALIWRRLHDANMPGPYYFFGCIPYVGSIVLLVFMLMPSKPEGARFDR